MCINRKTEKEDKTRFCMESCCTPKRFADVYWGIFTALFTFEVVVLILDQYSYINPVFKVSRISFHTLTTLLYITSLCKPDSILPRSLLSYSADFMFVACVLYYIVLAVFLFLFGPYASYDTNNYYFWMTVVLIVFALALWL